MLSPLPAPSPPPPADTLLPSLEKFGVSLLVFPEVGEGSVGQLGPLLGYREGAGGEVDDSVLCLSTLGLALRACNLTISLFCFVCFFTLQYALTRL